MAREIIEATANFKKKDALNSKSGISLQEFCKEGDFTVVECAIIKVTDEDTGDTQQVAAFVTPEHEYVTSISANIIEAVSDLIDIICDEGPVKIRVRQSKSKAGRDFLSLIIL